MNVNISFFGCCHKRSWVRPGHLEDFFMFSFLSFMLFLQHTTFDGLGTTVHRRAQSSTLLQHKTFNGLGTTLRLHAHGSRHLLLNSHVRNMEIISFGRSLPSSRLRVKPSTTWDVVLPKGHSRVPSTTSASIHQQDKIYCRP